MPGSELKDTRLRLPEISLGFLVSRYPCIPLDVIQKNIKLCVFALKKGDIQREIRISVI